MRPKHGSPCGCIPPHWRQWTEAWRPVVEFIEEAVQFYAGYISGQDANAYLPPALVSALNATLHSMEERICRLLFKLSVEMDMMMNVLAAGMEIPAEQLDRLRPQCVRNVKKTSGSISLDSAVERQER